MNQISLINSNNSISNSAYESLIDNSDLSFICKKISKMSTVLCLISSHLNDSDTLKMSIRKISDRCLDISSEILRISSRKGFNFGAVDYYCVLKDSVSVCADVNTVLGSLLVANLISEGNYRVIINEVGIILKKSQVFITEYCRENNSIFSRHAFDINLQPQAVAGYKGQNGVLYKNSNTFGVNSSSTATAPNNLDKGHVQIINQQSAVGVMVSNDAVSNDASNGVGPFVSAKVDELNKSPYKSSSRQVRKDVNFGVSSQGSSRQSRILDMLEKDSNLTVKDFARLITDCSEKTIQRELLGLVSIGKLKKEGERRWSRYSLA